MESTRKIAFELNDYEYKEFKRILDLKIKYEGKSFTELLDLNEDKLYFKERILLAENSVYGEYDSLFDEIVEIFIKLFPIDSLLSAKNNYGLGIEKFVYLNSEYPQIEDYGLDKEYLEFEDDLKLDIESFLKSKDKKSFFGESIIIGEYSEDFKKEDVVKKVSGLTHEVVLLNDGRIIKRGSNVNDQLSFKEVDDVIDVVCGRFFTAFFEKDGSVETYGYCDYSEPYVLFASHRSLSFHDLNISRKYKFDEGETLINFVYKDDENGRPTTIEMYDSDDKYIGVLYDVEEYEGGYSEVSTEGFMEAMLASTIKYDYYLVVEKDNGYLDISIQSVFKNAIKLQDTHEFMPVEDWKDIVSIEANYDALIGFDKDGNNFAYGFLVR